MLLLEEAGLPPGVINMVTGHGKAVSEVALADPDLAGIHFTGSTAGLPGPVEAGRRQHRVLPVATRASSARPAARTSSSPTRRPTSTCCAPRWSAAPSSTRARSARPPRAPTCRAASGPGCATTSRRSTDSLTMGDVTDLSNFMGAVIDDRAFAKHKAALERAKGDDSITVVAGGTYDDSEGWFVRPDRARVDRPGQRDLHDRVLRADPRRARLRRRRLRRDARPRWSRSRRTR